MRRAVERLRRAAIVLSIASGLSLVGAAPALAAIDLIVNSVSLSTSQLRPGESVGVTAVILNAGINATSSVVPIYVAFHVSQDAGCSPSGPELTTEIIAGGIGGFGSRTVVSTMTVPGGTALGDHYVCVEVDSLDLVSEQNEGNNWNQAPLEVVECLIDAHCDDSIACTVDFCDGSSNLCVKTPTNALCDDGVFCNGQETCSPTLGCIPGTPPSCADAWPCTVDTCDSVTDQCSNLPDDAVCDDGLFCTGAETCSPTQGCVAGTTPSCDDGVVCTVDACDAQRDQCTNAPDDVRCDDGLFCNGDEICTATGCQDGTPVCGDALACTQDACDESLRACLHPSVCPTGEWCTPNGCQGPPVFVGLGSLADTGDSGALGLSPDGETVVGWSEHENGRSTAVRWRSDSGIEPLEAAAPRYPSSAHAVSADGSVVVGVHEGRAFRWSPGSGISDLSLLDPPLLGYSSATDVAPDGSAISIGTGLYDPIFGFWSGLVRWSAASGLEQLIDGPPYPGAGTCGAGCSVIAGPAVLDDLSLARGAYRVVDGVVTTIPPPPECGAQPLGGFWLGVSMSPDGSVVIASCARWLYRWNEVDGLGGWRIPCTGGEIGAVAADGRTVVGICIQPGMSGAAIWDPGNGVQTVAAVLQAHGLSTSGWTLDAATDISDDGRTLVGYGTNPDGHREGWIAVLGMERLSDPDDDGIDSFVEMGAPNGGDGNGDGIQDADQSNVTSLPTATGSGYVTIELDGGCTQLSSVSTSTESVVGVEDPVYDYPLGLFTFAADCSSAIVTMYFHGFSSGPTLYRKYGPMVPGDPASADWYSMGASEAVPGTTWISGQPVGTMTLYLVDGVLGDDTGVDGRIVDAGGPTGLGTPLVPVSGVASRVALVLLLLLGGVGFGAWITSTPM